MKKIRARLVVPRRKRTQPRRLRFRLGETNDIYGQGIGNRTQYLHGTPRALREERLIVDGVHRYQIRRQHGRRPAGFFGKRDEPRRQ